MDKIISTPKPFYTKPWFKISLIGVFALIMLWAFLKPAQKTVATEANALIFSTVENGIYNDIVPVTGVIEPIVTIQIDAQEGGRVDEIFVEAGQWVEKGQPLVRLSNDALMLDYMNRETQIVEQINQLRNTRISLEQTQRNNMQELLSAEQLFENLSRRFASDSLLFAQKVITSIEFNESLTNCSFQQKKLANLRKSAAKDDEFRLSQLHHIDQSLELMQRNLHALNSMVENLTIKAPVGGMLSVFSPHLGETKVKGDNLGRVDVMSGFKVVANADEYHISRIKTGILGCFVLNNHTFNLSINKVFPQVNNGQFKIELIFPDSVPAAIRTGQTCQIKLKLGESSESLILKNGPFYAATGGNWVYVVEGDKAVKRVVKLGRQNAETVEIKSGLEVGEKVVISSYTQFNDADVLNLN